MKDESLYERVVRTGIPKINTADTVVNAGAPYTGLMNSHHGQKFMQIQHLVELALRHSPEVRDAESAWQAAQNDFEEAKGALWPKVDFNATSAAAKLGKGGNPYGNGTLNRLGATLSYTVFDGGRTSSLIASKQHIAHSIEAKYLLARNKIAFDTSNAFLQIARQQLLIIAYQGHLTQMKKLEKSMIEIVKVMPGRRSEFTQVSARVLQAEENLNNAVSKKRDYQIELIKLVGEKIRIDDVKESEIELEPLSLEVALLRAEEHPAIQLADAEVSASKDQVEVSQATQAPQLDLVASKLNGVDQMGYADPGQVYLSVKWNAFQGFSSKANERAALARAESSGEKLRQAVSDVEFKLNAAWADYKTQTLRITNLLILKQGTDQVRQDFFDQWQSLGRRSLLEVLGAESEHLNTVVSLINSQVDQAIAASKMHFESGEMAGWMVGVR